MSPDINWFFSSFPEWANAMARRPSFVCLSVRLSVCKLLRKSLLLPGKWPDRYQTCTRWSPGEPASKVCSRSRSRSKVTWHGHFCAVTKIASSRRQMNGSRRNLHTMVPRRVYIQDMLKFNVEMQGHVIPAHLEFHKKLLTQSFPAFALPNSGCLCRRYGTGFVPQFPYMLAILGSEIWND